MTPDMTTALSRLAEYYSALGLHVVVLVSPRRLKDVYILRCSAQEEQHLFCAGERQGEPARIGLQLDLPPG